MSNLLIDEQPIMVLPNLATNIGLNEAIVLQQIHYWIGRTNNVRDGNKWIYNSYQNWNKQFPFWSLATLKRTLTSLKKQGLLITGNYNKVGFDNTRWYRINYKKIYELDENQVSQSMGQNDPASGSKCTNGVGQNEQTNTRDYTETTTEINRTSKSSSHERDGAITEIINYLNEKAGTNYKSSTKKTQRDINSRFKEGFIFKDFKNVIDKKCEQWGKDEYWSKFLRPETLFGTKFEGYLNEKTKPVEKKSEYDDIF